MSPRERLWVGIAILVLLVAATVGILHQLDIVPLWVSTVGTVIMAAAAIIAAIIAGRSYRNEKNG